MLLGAGEITAVGGVLAWLLQGGAGGGAGDPLSWQTVLILVSIGIAWGDIRARVKTLEHDVGALKSRAEKEDKDRNE